VLAAAGRFACCYATRRCASVLSSRTDRDPNSFRAWLDGIDGADSARLRCRRQAFGEARNRTKDKDERSYLTAAIGDLNKASVTFNRTGH
jgi:hypothetical protein